MTKPILVTFTSPTCSGKSFLLNHVRDKGYPCLVSTTTRPPRANEKEGVDYYFISDQESKDLEAHDELAELAIFRGFRYGVSKIEFKSKLAQGPSFLIVEPTGLEHYVKPALDLGAYWLKYYVHTAPEVRIERFKGRTMTDFKIAMGDVRDGGVIEFDKRRCESIVTSAMDRLVHMLTIE